MSPPTVRRQPELELKQIAKLEHLLCILLQTVQRSERPGGAEPALRVHAGLLQAVLDSIAEGVVIADAQGNLVSVNAVAEEVVGLGLTDAPLERWTERYGCFLPDTVTPYPPHDLPLAKAIRGQRVEEDEVFIRHAGRPQGVWLSVNAAPLRDETGRLHGGIAVFRDITRAKKAEEAQRRSESLLHAIAQGAQDAIYVKDRQGRYLMINPAGAAYLKKTVEEVIGNDDTALFEPETARLLMDWDRRVMEGGEPMTSEEDATAAGETRTYLSIKVPYKDAAGNVIGVLGISRDISDRKQAEEQLRRIAAELARSNEDLQQFASVVSHDLQAPLRLVSRFCQALKDRCGGQLDPEACEYLGYVIDGTGRMEKLINNLLRYARAGTHGPPLGPVDSAAVFDRALADLGAVIGESGAIVTRGSLPVVRADESQLGQLFQNLLANAVKFQGSQPPCIHASARRLEGGWEFMVRDNGIGIEREDLERIFGVFERSHATADYPGTGLGLAICKRIVERHGGRIWAESEPGRGSVFGFTIPDEPEWR